MGDTNVQTGGSHAPASGGSSGYGLASSGLGHLHHHGVHGVGLGVGDTLSFGLGIFPDPDMGNSKSLPPFSSFVGEPEGLSEGNSNFTQLIIIHYNDFQLIRLIFFLKTE